MSSSNITAIGVNENVYYYSAGWVGFQILLGISIVFCSLTCFIAHSHSKLKNRFHEKLVKYLTGQGALWSLICFIQCSINSYHGYFYGGFIACELQSIYMLFFILMNGFTLCIMAYSTERKIFMTEFQKNKSIKSI